MRYYLDTEFVESGSSHPIDLISIGIVSSDGREYYAVNEECQFENASAWVWENVLYPIGIYSPIKYINLSDPFISSNTKNTISQMRSRQQIKEEIIEFVSVDKSSPEFWGYYADYDWVVFAQLFGTMMDLPRGFPMYCKDIKQWCDQLGNPQLPRQKKGNHNALSDAKHNKVRWEFLNNLVSKYTV